MKILLLGGSQEARRIALLLAGQPDLSLSVWLAQPDVREWPAGCETRVGEFGSGSGVQTWLRASNFAAVIDATHPFATDMAGPVASASQELGFGFVRIIRPEWSPTPADKWTFIRKASDAADHIPRSSRVFLATGRRDLSAFRNLADCRLLCRVKSEEPEVFPLANGRFIYAPGPFTVAGEQALFEREKVDWVVTRNSGGDGGWPKLAAARALGLPVALIRRPPQPPLTVVETVKEVLEWVGRRL
jgi:precorrin-6A/cobalt-precorrin-6A reductase